MPEARKAYRMSGMPADCVKMGLGLLEQQGIGIDIVYSGINNGSNVGTDTLYSGTVSAALEASVCGLPAVAVSVNSLTPEHYDVALELAVRASRLDYKAIDPRLVLNINTPNKPREEIRGVKVAELGLRGFYSWEIKSRDHEEGLSLAYGGEPLDKAEPYGGDSDIAASQQGYATVTPLHFNLTSRGLLEKVRASGIAD
jgi:5'-nucleotidase